jgi:hypothetical protein
MEPQWSRSRSRREISHLFGRGDFICAESFRVEKYVVAWLGQEHIGRLRDTTNGLRTQTIHLMKSKMTNRPSSNGRQNYETPISKSSNERNGARDRSPYSHDGSIGSAVVKADIARPDAEDFIAERARRRFTGTSKNWTNAICSPAQTEYSAVLQSRCPTWQVASLHSNIAQTTGSAGQARPSAWSIQVGNIGSLPTK